MDAGLRPATDSVSRFELYSNEILEMPADLPACKYEFLLAGSEIEGREIERMVFLGNGKRGQRCRLSVEISATFPKCEVTYRILWLRITP